MANENQYGRWSVGAVLGRGGNGTVYRARDAVTGEISALKVLRRPTSRGDRLVRFRHEIAFLTSHGDVGGVLPMIDFSLAAEQDELPWYTMPIAETLPEALGADPDPRDVVEAFQSFASTLARLSAVGVGHRDVKPANLFRLDGRWVVGDFGLVNYPEKEPVTRGGRRLGAVDFMAPEMRANADIAAAEPADVFGLAKSLWVVLVDEDLPLPGPHRPDDPAYSLSERVVYPYSAELDVLLERTTAIDPAARMRLQEFADELAACLQAPPESAAESSSDALTERISILTRSQRQREESRLEYTRLADRAFDELKDGGLSPAYHEAARLLPGFRSQYFDATFALEELAPSREPRWSERGFAGLLSTGDGGNVVMVRLAIGLRVEDEDGRATVAALGSVGLSHPVSPSNWSLLELVRQVRIGSVLFARFVEVVDAEFKRCLPVMQTEVARLLASRGE